MSEAIGWFFGAEESGIVLEDDCLPSPAFFEFAAELLERYREDQRVIHISGTHFPGDRHRPQHSYYASIFNHCWGWASWRRAWRHYDDALSDWPSLRDTDWLLKLGQGDRSFEWFWRMKFDALYRGEFDSWAYRWTYSAWRAGGLTLLPSRNLVVNLGIGEGATHTHRRWRHLRNWRLEDMKFPLAHPPRLEIDHRIDRWTARHNYRITPWHNLARRALAAPGIGRLLRPLAGRGRDPAIGGAVQERGGHE